MSVLTQGFKNQKSYFCVHDRAPHISCTSNSHQCTRVYNVYLAVHLLQRQKYFRAEVNLRFIPLTINPEPTDIFSDISSDNIFFWVLEKKKELSPSQILHNKLEKYLSLSIYKNIYFIHKGYVVSTENNCNIIYEGQRL